MNFSVSRFPWLSAAHAAAQKQRDWRTAATSLTPTFRTLSMHNVTHEGGGFSRDDNCAFSAEIQKQPELAGAETGCEPQIQRVAPLENNRAAVRGCDMSGTHRDLVGQSLMLMIDGQSANAETRTLLAATPRLRRYSLRPQYQWPRSTLCALQRPTGPSGRARAASAPHLYRPGRRRRQPAAPALCRDAQRACTRR